MRAKYYQENKEIPQKRARQRYQNLSKEVRKKKKSGVMVLKISQKTKSKILLSIEKNIKERKKKKKKKKMI